MKTISLFSSYGLGDLGLRAAGAEIVLMAELLEDRCEHLRRNFPDAEVVSGDLMERWALVADRAEEILRGEPPYLLVATPPCQGMSTNGAGKIARAVERGERPKLDPRNRLIMPALEIAKRLRPKWVVFENVVQMRNTVITPATPDDDATVGVETRAITDIIRDELTDAGYSGGWADVDFSRHGVPQDRQRLITVYGIGGPHDIGSLLPPEVLPPVTLRQAIGHLEELDSHGKRRSATDPLHRVKRMNDNHYWWVSRTPPGGTAYDNPCEDCGWNREPKKGKQMDPECQAYCMRCSALLPRPSIVDNTSHGVHANGAEGRRRIISGFRTAYKRMEWDRPAPTVTMNLMTPSSDNKLHPEQNRTLSPAEGAIIQTVDRYACDWGADPSDRELCDALGEAVPPLFFERLLSHLAGLPA